MIFIYIYIFLFFNRYLYIYIGMYVSMCRLYRYVDIGTQKLKGHYMYNRWFKICIILMICCHLMPFVGETSPFIPFFIYYNKCRSISGCDSAGGSERLARTWGSGIVFADSNVVALVRDLKVEDPRRRNVYCLDDFCCDCWWLGESISIRYGLNRYLHVFSFRSHEKFNIRLLFGQGSTFASEWELQWRSYF